ncbi:DUF4352 domain-containing protein [Bacillaceae bacterium SIJ1]|uniref:DUF4352 domain-containing protein n=1 Tax=Litoribacterium kuwaitense TaxID=1398745 RepID=UPI0013ED8C3D|nr:DUF4352 domain-containing protein [Litoribacterium kuwaitense]NGP44444.1 DUF4352 domain-containing protein [Litoribacterium kuwaitense]
MKNNRFRLLLPFIFLISILSACNGGNEPTDDADTEEAAGEVETDPAEDNEAETSKVNGESEADDQGSSEPVVGEGRLELELGETGEIQSTIGSYKVTVSNVEFTDTVDEETQPEGLVFAVADVTFENTSSDSLMVEDIADAWVYSDETELSTENLYGYNEVPVPEGEIQPGDTFEGQLLFHYDSQGGGKLQIGDSTYSNELVWSFEGPGQS